MIFNVFPTFKANVCVGELFPLTRSRTWNIAGVSLLAREGKQDALRRGSGSHCQVACVSCTHSVRLTVGDHVRLVKPNRLKGRVGRRRKENSLCTTACPEDDCTTSESSDFTCESRNFHQPPSLLQLFKKIPQTWAVRLQEEQESFASQLVPGTADVQLLSYGLVSESELGFVQEERLPVSLASEDLVIEQTTENVPSLYVALPLGAFSRQNKLQSGKALRAALRALKLIGVKGVTANVWWGYVEKRGPQMYDWSAYEELLNMLSEEGLKCQCTFSFHHQPRYPGTELPPWVMEVAHSNPDVLFADRGGQRSYDSISIGVDELELFHGRSALQMYKDFMVSFEKRFESDLGRTITEIAVGMGPNGELRYPSNPEADGRWSFPGIGEFQCYDKYMMTELAQHAKREGKPEWGYGGPHDAGSYKQWPHETAFFAQENGRWKKEYGSFFLEWYCGRLIEHGRAMSVISKDVFGKYPVQLLAKVAGMHWWHNSNSHAAELTAGYHHTRNHNGYRAIMQMLKEVGFGVVLTCMEMRDEEQPEKAKCSPEGLVDQVVAAATDAGVPIAGENAFERYDATAHRRLLYTARRLTVSFAFLRMGTGLFEPTNWVKFVKLVQKMKAVHQAEARLRLDASAPGGDQRNTPILEEQEAEEIPDSLLAYHKQLNRAQHRLLIERDNHY